MKCTCEIYFCFLPALVLLLVVVVVLLLGVAVEAVGVVLLADMFSGRPATRHAIIAPTILPKKAPQAAVTGQVLMERVWFTRLGEIDTKTRLASSLLPDTTPI